MIRCVLLFLALFAMLLPSVFIDKREREHFAQLEEQNYQIQMLLGELVSRIDAVENGCRDVDGRVAWFEDALDLGAEN